MHAFLRHLNRGPWSLVANVRFWRQVAHAMSQPSGGMQVYKTRFARSLGIAVGHRDGAGLLEGQNVTDLWRLQQRVDQR